MSLADRGDGSGKAAPSGARYRRTRPRGMAPWSPAKATRELLEQVEGVLDEYRRHLPMTIRQIFYRLVGAHGYAKTERAYSRLCENLVRARRAGIVRFADIRDDGGTSRRAGGFGSPASFWGVVRRSAHSYRRHRLDGQPVELEIWVEAAGMVPQITRVAHHYGVGVYSSGGFDSLTAKHNAALRSAGRDRPTTVLHVGDHDPSGCSVFDSAAEDVAAFARDLRADHPITFRRAAVILEQARRYDLPGAPPKKTDRRGDFGGETYQAEAMTPTQLAAEVRAAIEAEFDLEIFEELTAEESLERESLIEATYRLGEEEE